jgi:prepilin-type N-terminal cleavage/methylation domain-containing protein
MAKKGFTLAEVLITLAVIGVVAALTIPTVIRNYQERQTISALKKFYSQMSQAFKLAEIQNGSPEDWNWVGSDSSVGADNIVKTISLYLKTIQDCTAASGKTCFANNYVALGGAPWAEWSGDINTLTIMSKARLVDGMSFAIWVESNNCGANHSSSGKNKHLQAVCGAVFVDLNGNKKPNVLGKDFFRFIITKYGIIPSGIEDDADYRNLNSYCNKDNAVSNRNGYACAAWILTKDNMDYLKHSVSW